MGKGLGQLIVFLSCVSWVHNVHTAAPGGQAGRRVAAVCGVRLRLQAQQLHQVPHRVPAPGPHHARLPLHHLQQVLRHQERAQVSQIQAPHHGLDSALLSHNCKIVGGRGGGDIFKLA